MKAYRVEASIIQVNERESRVRTFIVAAHSPFEAIHMAEVYWASRVGGEWLSVHSSEAGFDPVAECEDPGVLAAWR